MGTRFNNYSPKTGHKWDYCGVVVGADEWKHFIKFGLKLGSPIDVHGGINGSKVDIRIKKGAEGQDPIRAGNTSKDIYWFEIAREMLVIDGKRPTDQDDIYIGPLKAVVEGGELRLYSDTETVRKANRKRLGNSNAGNSGEAVIGVLLADCKQKIATHLGTNPENIELRLSVTW